MAIPITSYMRPQFTRTPEGATLSRDNNAVFDAQPYGGSNTRAWRQQPQTGYNASYPRVSPLRVNLNNWALTLPPGAR